MLKYTNEMLIESLRGLKLKLGRNPTSLDLGKKNNVPERCVFEDRFGSWNNALIAAGLNINCYYRKWGKEDIVKWLKYKYDEFGETPGIRDFDADPQAPAKNTVRKLFGNWTNAIREANLPVKRFTSEDELIGVLKKLSRKLNRTPTRCDIDKLSGMYSYNPFVRKFGSYTAACLRAGLVPNDGRNNNIWKGWEKHCIEMARVIHGKIEVKNKDVVEGIPDIYVKGKELFIDAKTCGYRDFKDQIEKYCSNGHKLEFWCIFKGLENRSKKVGYVYAGELAKRMKKLGREDLAARCHQFLRNIFDEEQKVLM